MTKAHFVEDDTNLNVVKPLSERLQKRNEEELRKIIYLEFFFAKYVIEHIERAKKRLKEMIYDNCPNQFDYRKIINKIWKEEFGEFKK